MASIAGPSMGDLNAERSMDDNWASKIDQATPQGAHDGAGEFE